MRRIVLDTNVIISALLFDGVPEKAVLEVLAGRASGVTSPFIIEETSRILQTKFGLRPAELDRLQTLLGIQDIQYFQPFLSTVDDEPDNRILETAIHGRAECIVTGDKLLLELGSYEKVTIVTPATFLSKYSREAAG